MAAQTVRLQLGCGRDSWPGYINIDSDPRADADLRIDLLRVGDHFSAASVAEVAMIHSIGYLRLWEARDLFRDLFRIMRPEARLIIETPDMERISAALISRRGNVDGYLEAIGAIYAFDPNYIKTRYQYPPYAFGWSGWHLSRELTDAGFERISVLAPQTHGPTPWRDVRVEAVR